MGLGAGLTGPVHWRSFALHAAGHGTNDDQSIPTGAVNHQREFAAACITESADAAVRDGAVALAWTAIDAATDPALRSRLLSG